MPPASPSPMAATSIGKHRTRFPWTAIVASLLLAALAAGAFSWLMLGRLDSGYLASGLGACAVMWALVGPRLHALARGMDEAAEHSRLLLQSAAIPVVIVAAHDGKVLFANHLATAYFGVPPDDTSSLSARDFWADTKQRDDYVARLHQYGRIAGYEAAMRTRSGETKWALLAANLTRFDNVAAILTVIADITERRRQDEELTFFSEALKQCHEAIVLADAEHRFRYVNPAFTRLFGYGLDEVRGRPLELLQTSADATHHTDYQGESLRRTKDGREVPVQLAVSSVLGRAGQVMGHVGVMTDMRQVKEQQRHLTAMAHYDILTGVANRALLGDRMQQAMALARRNETLLAVCYLDLDGFKPINDRHGHEVGDQVLICIAQRLRGSLREGDTVARLGGDEFVLILSGIEALDGNDATLWRILEIVAAPIEVGALTLAVSASLGVTYYPRGEASPDTLLRLADQAMYRAKQDGKNRYYVLDPLAEA